jgi:hypothetical protein
VGETPWRFKSSHPHSHSRPFAHSVLKRPLITVPVGIAEERDEALPVRAVVTMPPDWVIGAFVDAVERARAAAALDPETVRPISIAVAEALMWIYALQETKRDVGRGRDISAKLASEPIVKALKFVRGRAQHHWTPIASFDAKASQWVWLKAENLPLPPEGRYADAPGESFYKELLEGRPLLSALGAFAERLKSIT